jgi:hypothetical protein
MSKFRLAFAITVAVASVGLTLTVTSRGAMRPLPLEPLAQLSRIQDFPDEAGPAVYEGSVFVLDGDQAPLFRYERRVQPVADRLRSTHITFNPAGEVGRSER